MAFPFANAYFAWPLVSLDESDWLEIVQAMRDMKPRFPLTAADFSGALQRSEADMVLRSLGRDQFHQMTMSMLRAITKQDESPGMTTVHALKFHVCL